MRIEVGVNIQANTASVVAWVWCPGGRRAEDDVLRILGEAGKIKSEKFPGWLSGSVALKEVKTHIPERWDEAVEFDSLVNEVNNAFESFKASDIDAIAVIARN